MCNCEKKDVFKSSIKKAYRKTVQTGNQHVVYGSEKIADLLWVAPEEVAKKDDNICCYFVPTSETEYKKVEKPKKKSK